MKRLASLLFLVGTGALPFACGGGKLAGSNADAGTGSGGSGGDDGAPSSDGSSGMPRPPWKPTSKLDLLFMIQNSSKTNDFLIANDFLTGAVPGFIHRLLNPNCVDGSGNVLGSSQNGQCSQGALEFLPVVDMHVGIVTSSLGGRGGDQCPDLATNPAAPNLSAHTNDKGELVARGGVAGNPTVENPVADAPSPDNFLWWNPYAADNGEMTQPPSLSSESQLVSDLQSMFLGVNVHGCGFTAPLESWYRFLVQPDPYADIIAGPTNATRALAGVDATIVKQRHDFLRPDSVVAVVVVANKPDEVIDPLAMGGQGWAFMSTAFPGSPNMATPEGTIECTKLDPNNPSKTGPNDPNCTSCAFVCPYDPNRCPNYLNGAGFVGNVPMACGGKGNGGYLDPSDDALNVRAFHQKQRFGVDAQFPVDRYVTGLSSFTVPDRDHEHDANGNYAPSLDCDNPLFSMNLPADASSDLCHLPPGPRTPSQVFFVDIGGVPHQLLQTDPSNPDSPQKTTLSATDWTTVLGADPLHYAFAGADFHMLESEADRAGSSCPDTAADDCDPINGREWATNKSDLQFACIFPLAMALDCTSPGPGDQYKGACACATGALNANTQLCEKTGTGYTQTQINGRAYPTIRPLAVARALGSQSVVGSICPIHAKEAAAGDPLYGYRPTLQALTDRLSSALAK
jgi:hypothetical protein